MLKDIPRRHQLGVVDPVDQKEPGPQRTVNGKPKIRYFGDCRAAQQSQEYQSSTQLGQSRWGIHGDFSVASGSNPPCGQCRTIRRTLEQVLEGRSTRQKEK